MQVFYFKAGLALTNKEMYFYLYILNIFRCKFLNTLQYFCTNCMWVILYIEKEKQPYPIFDIRHHNSD